MIDSLQPAADPVLLHAHEGPPHGPDPLQEHRAAVGTHHHGVPTGGEELAGWQRRQGEARGGKGRQGKVVKSVT